MKNWTPLWVAVLAIVVTQVCCTWAIINKLSSNDTFELMEIASTLDKIETQTEATANETERTAAAVEYLGETRKNERAIWCDVFRKRSPGSLRVNCWQPSSGLLLQMVVRAGASLTRRSGPLAGRRSDPKA